MYVLVVAILVAAGFALPRYPTGFIASVLFLVPGYPLIGGLFDLMQTRSRLQSAG